MLAETVREWTKQWVEQGSTRAASRNVRCYVARRRASSTRLSGSSWPPRWREVTEPSCLAQVGEWII